MIRRDRFQAKPANLLTPIDSRFLFAVEELYGTRYQSGSFSLIDVGSAFHCLRSFTFFFFLAKVHKTYTGAFWTKATLLPSCWHNRLEVNFTRLSSLVTRHSSNPINLKGLLAHCSMLQFAVGFVITPRH